MQKSKIKKQLKKLTAVVAEKEIRIASLEKQKLHLIKLLEEEEKRAA